MNVAVVIYADEALVREMDDKVLEQAGTWRPCPASWAHRM
jgi:hypothetical protein